MRQLLIGSGVVAVAVIVLSVRGSSDDGKDKVDKFMRAKLVHSQKVLEGLTTEDYDTIARHGQSMGLLSRETGWRVLQTPEYMQRSTEFRRSTEALVKAGRDRNLDGATLAFVDVTLKCVECHKYVRRVRHARWFPPESQPSLLPPTLTSIPPVEKERGL